MPRTVRSVVLVVVAAIALSLALVVAADAAAPAMREVDVVRLVMAGRPSPEIVAEIERRTVAFDVSDEMLDELRLAGVPATVIAAMVARQRAQDAERAAADPVAERPPEPALPRLVVRLTDDGTSPDVLVLERRVPAALAAAAGLAARDEPYRLDDVAVFLACRRAEHVPDQWRSRSPLGRDFVSMPRHRMLAFVAGATSGPRRLRLELPARIEADLDHRGAHDLTLGVAVQLDGRYYRLVDAARDEVTVEGVTTLEGRVGGDRAGRLPAVEVRWVDPAR